MADEAANRDAFRIQHKYCTVMGAPITALVCGAIADTLDRSTGVGRRVLDWPGNPTLDALPLRLVGGLHALYLAGEAGALGEVFAGRVTDGAAARAAVAAACRDHDAALLPWLDGPPQTNDAGRAGPLMLGLMAVTRRFGLPVDLLEIGSSAGLNLMIDRFGFDLSGVRVGPTDAPVQLRPEWRGAPPQPAKPGFARIRGVDVQPIDLSDDAAATRLRAYVWADNPDRLDRLTHAIAMIRARPVDLVAGDAADWVEARLAEPQAAGTARVLMHSVVWQYLGAERQERIEAAMIAAGARATADRALAWVRMEPDRALDPRMELWVRMWPGDGAWVKLADTQAHGAWIVPTP